MALSSLFARLMGKKQNLTTAKKSRFHEEGPEWGAGAFLICEKCGSKLAKAVGPDAPNPAGELKNWLKTELKSRGAWGKVRVMTSSCLDICPKGALTIGIMSDLPRENARCLVVDPEKEKSEILNEIIRYAENAPK